MKIKIIALLLFSTFASISYAKMPFYEDDREFERCTQMTGDWDRCMSEETRRDLNDVKITYREVLANPKLKDWNGNMEENQQMLHDMYASWTAFRNRLCSLSKVSSQYTGTWKDEEKSCNLYYVKHHKDHFQCINDMLLGRADARDDFITEEHDGEYSECLKTQDKEKCLLSEFQRSSEKIKALYKKFYDSKNTSAWNNGADFGSGNYRDMFDSWVAYRNRLCSLSVFAYQNFPEHQISKNQCLQYLNREKLETLENLYDLSNRAVNSDKAQKKAEEGGRLAGSAIAPLEKRLETTESLTTNNALKEVSEQKTEDKVEQNTSTLPSWAKRK